VTSASRPELAAPAGNRAMLQAVLAAGADAVYFGVRGFNMRATARNFSAEQLSEIVAGCHDQGARAYLTVNTLIYQQEISLLERLLEQARTAGVDAVIAWDLAALQAARAAGLPIHLSTQASVSNSLAATAYRELGVRRCVLARECSLEQIEAIRAQSGLEIEVFAHGAMCVSVSGRCYMSQFLSGRSANRGDCLQPCRRAYDSYRIRDRQDGEELVVGNDYVLSPRDLCTLPFLDRLAPRVDALKIEGRARSVEYAATVVRVYRRALEAVAAGAFSRQEVEAGLAELRQVYNRGFSAGFYLGRPLDDFTRKDGSQAEKRKIILGRVENFYTRIMVAEILVTSGQLRAGDDILVIGPTTGLVETRVESLEIEHRRVECVRKGQRAGVKLPERVRRGDQVFVRQDAGG
jgi:putative protease